MKREKFLLLNLSMEQMGIICRARKVYCSEQCCLGLRSPCTWCSPIETTVHEGGAIVKAQTSEGHEPREESGVTISESTPWDQ